MDYETVIGFEVHCELKTATKIWCGCSTEFGAPPNTQVCPVCLGLPGALPVLNRKALELSLRVATALGSAIPDRSWFDRKNYYYPDLPKNYQISQQYQPLGRGGTLRIQLPDGSSKDIGFDNIHLEEDAGKNIHPEGREHVDYSLVDLNRAGTPLLEIVTAPDLRNAAEAEAFMRGIKALLEYVDASDCKMEQGRLRFELNISLRKPGAPFGQKVEVKNLNSIASVLRCIESEQERQAALLDAGGRVAGETRLWDEAKLTTRAMRSKETSYDYRYFPDPDLVEVVIDDAMRERIAAELPELPLARRERFQAQHGLSGYDASVLTADRASAEYFEAAVAAHPNPKAIANWMMTELFRRLKEMGEDASAADFPVRAESLAEMVRLIDGGELTGALAKKAFPLMVETGKGPKEIVREQGWEVMDSGSLEPVVRQVLEANAKMVEDYRGGKKKAIGGLMGQVMRATKGQADPAAVQQLLEQILGEPNG